MIYIVKALFRLTGFVGTYEILKRIKDIGKCSYKDLPDTMCISSKNARIKEFLNQKLITHHFDRGNKRIEWYEITEKGIKFLSILELLDELNVENAKKRKASKKVIK